MTHLLARFLSHAHIACVRGRTHIHAQAQAQKNVPTVESFIPFGLLTPVN